MPKLEFEFISMDVAGALLDKADHEIGDVMDWQTDVAIADMTVYETRAAIQAVIYSETDDATDGATDEPIRVALWEAANAEAEATDT